MSWIALGLGLVLVIEGLVFALAPSRLDDLVAAMAATPGDRHRRGGARGRADLAGPHARRVSFRPRRAALSAITRRFKTA